MSDSIEDRVESLEVDVDALKVSVDKVASTQVGIMERLSSLDTSGEVRASAALHAFFRLEDKVDAKFEALTTRLAEQTGAQKQQNKIAEQRLMRLKQLALIIGIVGTILSAAFSYQEIASYIWTHILHLKEPWL